MGLHKKHDENIKESLLGSISLVCTRNLLWPVFSVYTSLQVLFTNKNVKIREPVQKWIFKMISNKFQKDFKYLKSC